MKFKLIVFTVLLAVVLAFVYQNSVPVAVRFFNGEYVLPFALLLMVVLAVGVLLGMLLVLRRQSYNRKKKTAKEAQQKVAAATAASDAGHAGQDSVTEPLAQETTVVTGEDHESNNTDHRGNSRVW
ncbi:MAG: DUF1049 domain-containing protein [Desulfuromonadales bacterium]|nr:DUF1049 domain-containing protein [Desulfuromonadales bacterium]